MTDLCHKLERDRDALVARAREIGPEGCDESVREALDRLIGWTCARVGEFAYQPPRPSTAGKPADATVGVSRVSSINLFWRAYPRQEDGAKVTLDPGRKLIVDASLREAIVELLEAMRGRDTIGPGKQLEIGLDRIASANGWEKFERALEIARRGI